MGMEQIETEAYCRSTEGLDHLQNIHCLLCSFSEGLRIHKSGPRFQGVWKRKAIYFLVISSRCCCSCSSSYFCCHSHCQPVVQPRAAEEVPASTAQLTEQNWIRHGKIYYMFKPPSSQILRNDEKKNLLCISLPEQWHLQVHLMQISRHNSRFGVRSGVVWGLFGRCWRLSGVVRGLFGGCSGVFRRIF